MIGLLPEVRETPREHAFCAHAILTSDIFEVPNALEDTRFQDNPLVTDAPNIRFYAGMPLIDSAGHALGTLCVIDQIPRHLEPHQRAALKSISDAVLALIEARLLRSELTRMQRRTMEEIEAA